MGILSTGSGGGILEGAVSDLTPQLLELGGQLEETLARLSVPAFATDDRGIIRWLNPVALELVGDLRGRSATQLVAPDELQEAQRAVARKLIGVDGTTNDVRTIRTRDGWARAEICGTPLAGGGRIVGLFGIANLLGEPERPPRPSQLTPRQQEVLRLLAAGLSTRQIAERLSLSQETVRNHVRGVLRALEAHSRLEAVVRAHELGLV